MNGRIEKRLAGQIMNRKGRTEGKMKSCAEGHTGGGWNLL